MGDQDIAMAAEDSLALQTSKLCVRLEARGWRLGYPRPTMSVVGGGGGSTVPHRACRLQSWFVSACRKKVPGSSII